MTSGVSAPIARSSSNSGTLKRSPSMRTRVSGSSATLSLQEVQPGSAGATRARVNEISAADALDTLGNDASGPFVAAGVAMGGAAVDTALPGAYRTIAAGRNAERGAVFGARVRGFLERETRFELATSTLARLRSTN